MKKRNKDYEREYEIGTLFFNDSNIILDKNRLELIL